MSANIRSSAISAWQGELDLPLLPESCRAPNLSCCCLCTCPEDKDEALAQLACAGVVATVFSSLVGLAIASENFKEAQEHNEQLHEARRCGDQDAEIVFRTVKKQRQFSGVTALIFSAGAALLTAVIVMALLKHYHPHKNIDLEFVKKLAIAGGASMGGALIFLILGKTGSAPFVGYSEGRKAYERLKNPIIDTGSFQPSAPTQDSYYEAPPPYNPHVNPGYAPGYGANNPSKFQGFSSTESTI